MHNSTDLRSCVREVSLQSTTRRVFVDFCGEVRS